MTIIQLLTIAIPHSNYIPFNCYVVRRNRLKTKNISELIEELPSSLAKEVQPNEMLFLPDDCWMRQIFFRDKMILENLATNGYYFHCVRMAKPQRRALWNSSTIQRRFLNNLQHKDAWFFTKRIQPKRCWDTIEKINHLTLIEGLCGVFLNLLVLLTTLKSRILKESVPHILVANMALGDLLMSMYIVILTLTRLAMGNEQYVAFYNFVFCKIIGCVFLIGQISSPTISFIMTVERYLAVVYCMKPHVRLTMRTAFCALAAAWFMSISLSVSFMTSASFSEGTETTCIPLPNKEGVHRLMHVGLAGILLYVISMGLYAHLYFDFRRTNRKTVQLRRENHVAQKIGLIILTNLMFFVIPLILIAIVESLNDDIPYVHRYIFGKTFGFIFLSFNACLNPVLFSLRNEAFRSELKKTHEVFTGK